MTNIENLIYDLSSRYLQKRSEAKKKLIAIGKPAVPALISILDSPYHSQFVKRFVISSLGEIGDESAKDHLAKITDSSLEPMAAEAQKKIAAANKREMIASALAAPSRSNIGLVLRAIEELGKTRSNQSFQKLIELSEHELPEIREKVAKVFGDSRSKKAIPYLLKMLTDSQTEVQQSAILAIGRIKEQQSVKLLLPFLKDPNPVFRHTTLSALGRVKDPEITNEIIPFLSDPDSAIRKTAAASIGMLKDPNMLPHLLPLLHDNDFSVRLSAALAICKFDAPNTTLHLQVLLEAIARNKLDKKDSKASLDLICQFAPDNPELLVKLMESRYVIRTETFQNILFKAAENASTSHLVALELLKIVIGANLQNEEKENASRALARSLSDKNGRKAIIHAVSGSKILHEISSKAISEWAFEELLSMISAAFIIAAQNLDRNSESYKETKKEIVDMLLTINKRRNELLSTEVNAERRTLKPPSGSGGNIFRQAKPVMVRVAANG